MDQVLHKWRHPECHFFKLHGTGNDFIVIDGTGINGNVFSRQKLKLLAANLCHRKFGIGADGLLIIRKVNGTYKMEVINSDGSQPNMCGNGLRCFVSLLFNQKLIPSNYQVLTDDGYKNVCIQPVIPVEQGKNIEKYLVTLMIGKGGAIEELKDSKYTTIYLTTIGVPHLVVFLNEADFKAINFEAEGLQFQKEFDANINFCLIEGQNQIRIKTCQRGAGMTYSCGTGVSSSVYVAVSKSLIHTRNVKTITDGGSIQIQVGQNMEVLMKGPAQIICEGQYFD